MHLVFVIQEKHTDFSVCFYIPITRELLCYFLVLFREDRKIPPAEQIIANAV
jgi:hypothetical protein